MKTGLIYCLVCPISKEYRYVGKTIHTLKKRLLCHKSSINYTKSYKNNWLKKLQKLNLLNDLQIVLIEKCNINNLNEREIYWIKYFKNNKFKLTNLTLGGDGSLGFKHTQASKNKIGEAGKNRKGYKATDDAKKNISLSLMGNTRHLNKKHTQYTKDKISLKKIGSIPSNRKKIEQYDKNDNLIKIWLSAYHAAIELNLNQGNISQVANNIRKTCGGYIWKYK